MDRIAAGVLMFLGLSGFAWVPGQTGSGPAVPNSNPVPHPLGYVAYRVAQPITLDGKLTDAAWAAAPWSEDFVDIEGAKQPKPRHRTRMKILWDDAGLYIGAELEEPHIWATLTKHDSVIFHDNDFEVFINPKGDNHHYGELELNALNTTWDLYLDRPYKDGGKAINGWEIKGMKTAVFIDGTINNPNDVDRSWSVEIFTPWESWLELNHQAKKPQDGDQWRINFSRVEWDTEIKDGKYVKVKKPEYNWVWSPQGVIDMHRPDRWGYVQFSSAKPGEGKFIPDATAPIRDQLHQLYYAQIDHFKKNKRYAKTLQEIGVKPTALGLPTLTVGRNIYEATLEVPQGQERVRWTILHNSHIFREVMKP